MPTLTIDGREVTVPEGTSVIQAAERLGIFIPRYCYHPGLSVAGNCRICLVDVEKSPKLQIACNLPVTQGMVVRTASDKAKEGRRSVLEFLLANHPLDCPVCDQSGECDLQNFYMNFGLYASRFQERKVKKKKAVALGPHVMLDQERCILCSRCVRFTDEITKTGEFGIFQRGDRAEVGLYPGQVLDNPYSANVVDICPVGALTERDFRFKARVWYLSSASTLCNGCSQGCNMSLHYVLDRPHLNEGARVVRVKPRVNPDVNRWWLCDEGRYGFAWFDRERLTRVRTPAGVEPTWDGALGAIEKTLGGTPRIGVIASTQLTNEELYLIRELFQRSLGARVGVSGLERTGTGDGFLIQADRTPNTRGASLLGLTAPASPSARRILDEALGEGFDLLWVFGHDLTEFLDEEVVRKIAQKVGLLVFSGTNENRTARLAHCVLPTAAYVEKDGTFVNVHGRIQRIGRAFPPLSDSREDWRLLLALAGRMGRPFEGRAPDEIFKSLAGTEASFAGLTYEKIGDQGIAIAP